MKQYFVYILTNKANRVLYTGITGNLERRIYEHRNKQAESFTKKYNLTKLVYCEVFSRVEDAIAAEKKIKGWLRIKKIQLIESKNPDWKDLSIALAKSIVALLFYCSIVMHSARTCSYAAVESVLTKSMRIA